MGVGLGFVALSFQALFGRSCADFLPFLLLRCPCGHCCHSPAVLAVGSFGGFPWQGLGKGFRPRVAPCHGPKVWAAGFSQYSHERCSPAYPALLGSKPMFWQRCPLPVPASFVVTTLAGVWFLPEAVRRCEWHEKVREWRESLLSPAPPHVLPLCKCFLQTQSPI